MAKKKKEEQVEEVITVHEPVKVKPVKKNSWEIKDRTSLLKGNKEPLTFTIPSKHTRRHPLLWFDADKNTQRELRYATNMSSPFVDEQKGEVTMGHIIFRDGILSVPKENVGLQQLLSLYHPMRDKKYMEHVPQRIAQDQLQDIEFEIEALNAAKNMDIDHAEAIVRVKIGSKVSSLSSKEIKRDLLLLAKKNPQLFLALANDDNVQLRNFGINAVELGIIKLSSDQRSFHWGSEGVEVYKSIEKRL